MSESDQRHITRDSLFVLAALRVAGRDQTYRVKVRNLSAGGLMAEGDLRVVRGTPLSVELRNVGWVEGSVAWVQETRFGIAFDEEIDPLVVRGQATTGHAEGFVPLRPIAAVAQANPGSLRKI
jgi:hypothetical protein